MVPPDSDPQTSSVDSPVEPISASRFSLSPSREICLDGVTLLSDVPRNVILSPFSSFPCSSDSHCSPPHHILKSVSSNSENGAFLGFSVNESSDQILNSIGRLIKRKFLSIFSFKPGWTTMWVCSNGYELQMGTQWVLLQVPELRSYALILPFAEGNFRSTIRPGIDGNVILSVESGSSDVKAKRFPSCAYLHAGDNPFDLMRDALAAVGVHLGTAYLLDEKSPSGIIDKFGWCSSDPIHQTVELLGDVIKSFTQNGLPPRFLVIDNGLHTVNKYNENDLVSDLRTKFPSLEDVYVRGFVELRKMGEMYKVKHSSPTDAGNTRVKCDLFQPLGSVCEGHGGHQACYGGLTQGLKNKSRGNGIIDCMEHSNDFFRATKQISLTRVADDLSFEDSIGDPMGVHWLQGVHMIHCSFNSLWQGQFMQPDWDAFLSKHPFAEFHAASRAICGGPVYVSDKVGHHGFNLLKKLVLPDGTILRCQHYALPTRDCLFENSQFDGKSALKVWNLNKYGGVLGLFNCQGAGWHPGEQRIKAYPQSQKSVSGWVSPEDVEWEQKDFTAQFRNTKEYAVYLHKADNLYMVKPTEHINITLQPSSFELFTISPVQKLGNRAKFAPIGLENMFNCGGAIQLLDYESTVGKARIKVKGLGKFLAFSTEKPGDIFLNGEKVDFIWSTNGILRFPVPWTGGGLSDVVISMS